MQVAVLNSNATVLQSMVGQLTKERLLWIHLVSLYIQSRMIAPPGWAPLQSKQSVLSLIVLSDWSSLN